MKKLLLILMCTCFIQGFEYHQLEDVTEKQDEDQALFEHAPVPFVLATPGSITSVAWSPQGDTIAYGVDDGTACTVNPESKLKKVIDANFNKGPLCWSPDGVHIAYGRLTKPLVIYNTVTKKHEVFENQELKDTIALDWSSNSDHIAFCGTLVGIMNLREDTITQWSGHVGTIKAIKCSPDSLLLASGAIDKVVKSWDAYTHQCTHTFKGHTAQISALDWHPKNNQLASGSKDNSVHLWDTRSGDCIQGLYKHTARITTLQYHPDGTKLVTASFDNKVLLWDLRTYASMILTDRTRAITSLSIHPKGSQLVYGTIDACLCTRTIPNEVDEPAIEIVSHDGESEDKPNEGCCIIL